jgi:MFS family permease
MVVSAQSYFFPIYVKESLGLAAIVVSTFVSLRQMSGFATALVGGTLVDTLGRKWTLVLGLGFSALGSAAFLARLPWMVGALWVVVGIAMSLESLASQGYLIGVASGAGLGTTSALYHWGFTLGGALGSPVAGRLLDRQGYATFAPALIGLAAVTAFLGAVFLPRLQHASVEQSRISWREALAGYVEIVKQPVVRRLGLLRFLPTCYYGMAMVLIPLLINAETDSKTSVAIFATSSQILATLAQLVVGRVADRIGPRLPTLSAMSAVLAAAVGLALYAGQLWGLYVFGILGIAAAWALSTLMPVLVSGTIPAVMHGRVLGTLVLLWNLAMVLSAMIGGALVEVLVGLPFAVAAALNVGTLVLAVGFFREMFGTEKGSGANAASSS